VTAATTTPRAGARLLVIGDDGAPDAPELGARSGAQIQLDESPPVAPRPPCTGWPASSGCAPRAWTCRRARRSAAFAAASAFGEFTAAYLGLGLGLDPGATRAGREGALICPLGEFEGGHRGARCQTSASR